MEIESDFSDDVEAGEISSYDIVPSPPPTEEEPPPILGQEEEAEPQVVGQEEEAEPTVVGQAEEAEPTVVDATGATGEEASVTSVASDSFDSDQGNEDPPDENPPDGNREEEIALLDPNVMNTNMNGEAIRANGGSLRPEEVGDGHDDDSYGKRPSNGGLGGDNISNVSYTTLEEKEQQRSSKQKDSRVRCCDYALCRCLRRVPYATLFAFLLLAGGLALMTYEIIMIRETADDLFDGTVLNEENSPYKKGLNMLLWLLIALVTVIAIFGFFFLVLACFSSGPSKKNTCGQRFTKCVNRISISVVTIIAYLICIAWVALSMALMLGLTFMLMVQSYCTSLEGEFTPESCVDLAQYGMVPSKSMDAGTTPASVPAAQTTPMPIRNTTICGETLEDFCGMHDDIKLNVWLTVTGSIIIVISLIHFLMALAANHTYLRVFRKGYRSVPKGTNAFPGFRYSDGELPIQEPVNMSDENTRF